MAEQLMHLSGLTYRYPGDREPVINGLDFAVDKGASIGLIAPNGSGKTTLFHLMMGLLKPEAGVITAFGREVSGEKGFKEVRRRVGLLFQDADDQLFSPTVLEDVAFGPMNLGLGRHEALDKARGVLSELGLSGYEERITFRLSGGEKRMVALATVLAMDPDLLLLDEPTTGLDRDTFARLVAVLQASKVARVVISHDFDFLEQVTDSLCSLVRGKVVTDEGLHLHRHAHVHRHGDRPHHHH
ncbi:energy-coupling factor ABC transporter ATP-binding protein [Desulfoluna butyratoxydans]|uniref:Abc transporter-like n=1 Tax=Desulfoluna butyratoxydans TaxID=231438 RepID=A0A4U8YWL8_9BACT|nr:ABC transporter ATP-binding protein [Desulfoluna butyratoxydans]VFQ45823.1 abc transporter-like [Desulfoluna butyratoxydans]